MSNDNGQESQHRGCMQQTFHIFYPDKRLENLKYDKINV